MNCSLNVYLLDSYRLLKFYLLYHVLYISAKIFNLIFTWFVKPKRSTIIDLAASADIEDIFLQNLHTYFNLKRIIVKCDLYPNRERARIYLISGQSHIKDNGSMIIILPLFCLFALLLCRLFFGECLLCLFQGFTPAVLIERLYIRQKQAGKGFNFIIGNAVFHLAFSAKSLLRSFQRDALRGAQYSMCFSAVNLNHSLLYARSSFSNIRWSQILGTLRGLCSV